MTSEEAIKESKQFRKDADELLQRMKAHRARLQSETVEGAEDRGEVTANHILSIRDLESAIMRQGMVLKCIGANNPYPQSYNPQSKVVEPTADNLKL